LSARRQEAGAAVAEVAKPGAMLQLSGHRSVYTRCGNGTRQQMTRKIEAGSEQCKKDGRDESQSAVVEQSVHGNLLSSIRCYCCSIGNSQVEMHRDGAAAIRQFVRILTWQDTNMPGAISPDSCATDVRDPVGSFDSGITKTRPAEAQLRAGVTLGHFPAAVRWPAALDLDDAVFQYRSALSATGT